MLKVLAGKRVNSVVKMLQMSNVKNGVLFGIQNVNLALRTMTAVSALKYVLMIAQIMVFIVLSHLHMVVVQVIHGNLVMEII